MENERKLHSSDQMLQIVLEQFPGIIFWKDVDSVYLGCNQAFAIGAGVGSPVGITGKTDYDLPWNAIEAEKYRADDSEVINTGIPKLHIVEMQHQVDGRLAWFDTSKLPLRDSEGVIIGILGTSIDITDRVKAEQGNIQIMDQLRKQSRALEQIPTSVVITDLQGNIEYVNPKFSEVTGYAFEEVKGKNPRILKSGNTSLDEYSKMWKEIKSGNEWHGEIQNKRKNGEFFWESISISCVIGESGKITHYLAAKEDITTRKRLEQQLLQSQKLEGVGTLAGGIAHDFNNLLAMVLGSAELLGAHLADQPKLKKYVERIIEASERGTSISRQLLIFSRPDQAILKPISLSQTILELEELLHHFLPKTITIESEINVDNGIILGDAGQIHQALLNLAINAGDAMTNVGRLTIAEKSVSSEFMNKHYSVGNSVQYVALSVSDTGTGIDESVIAKIFDPFYSTKERGKGTGLGLAMVHGIVKNHNGFIDVVSTVGKGSTFTMYFPILLHEPEEKMKESIVSLERRNETILLVDDEEHIREMITEFLEDSGYQVYATSNGIDALEIFGRYHESIDLVISDLGMPKMGGEELYRKIRKIDGKVPVMVSSGYLDGTTKENLLKLGIKDVITKPSKLQDIQKAILVALGSG